jgi:hypothetical protein
MRSSKSRSRNKSNRNRPNTVGNVVNRVFDSSGPEGKVRGTPQQIIEKYNQLARDAQLSNDRVATENFQQHAEHYLRLLGAAQKEMDDKREQQERENRDRQIDRDRDRPQHGGDSADDGNGPQPDIAEAQSHGETSALVETPESKTVPKQRTPRKPRHKAPPESEGQSGGAQGTDTQRTGAQQAGAQGNGEQDGGSQDAPRPRRARKPKTDPAQAAAHGQADQGQADQGHGDGDDSKADKGARPSGRAAE